MKITARVVPFLTAVILLIAGAVGGLLRVVRETDGVLVYPLDDTYIHMALARNLALRGEWAINPGQFSGSSSSPFWVLLLSAADRLVGVHDVTPFVLALLFGLASLYAADRIWQRTLASGIYRVLAGIVFIYLVPLVPLVLTGMEHTLHLFSVILLAGIVAGALQEQPSRWCRPGPAAAVAALATAVRYESLFVIGPLAVLSVLRRRYRTGLWLLVGAAVPVVLYGIYSCRQGGFFLPSPLLLKGRMPRSLSGYELLWFGWGRILRNPHLLMTTLLILAVAAVSGARRVWGILALGVAAGILLHAQFAGVGYFYRYESYLIGLVLVIAVAAAAELTAASRQRGSRFDWLSGISLVCCIGALLWPLHQRARSAMEELVPAAKHIYQQHYQLARLLRQAYAPDGRIATDDIGAAAYYSGCHIYDLLGIADVEVARARRSGQYNSQWIESYLERHGIQLVVVHTGRFTGEQSLPASLVRLAKWKLQRAYWDGEVEFYAPATMAAAAMSSLRAFEEELPAPVEVSYYDVAPETGRSP